ncbi:MAG: outer membrane protein assembly factor BamA [Bdellovibrio sp.]
MAVVLVLSTVPADAQTIQVKPDPRATAAKTPKKNVRAQNAQKKAAVPAPVVPAEVKASPSLTVSQITVEGNRKIEKDAVLARLKTQVNGPYTDAQVKEDILSLFKSGFFYDVQVYRDVVGAQVGVTYKVLEKPSVAEIVFEGNSEIKTEELQEASGLKAYEILDMGKIRDAIEKLQKLYEDKGFFLAKIEPKVEDVIKGETVKLMMNVQENDKVKVKKITFLGNRRMKDGQLKGRMLTGEGGYFSFLSGSGAYKQDAFDRDMQILRFLYFNEGYVQVKIDRPQVYVTPDRKNIYITIRVEEGEQFDVGDIDFAGDLLFGRDELASAIEINKRQVFSYEVLQKDLSELQAKYGDLGYAYANVIPRTRINEKERKVDITFEFDKGNKVYYGQFNIVGNSKTRDKVVRRELKIKEGELYHETSRRKSVENIQRLGFFDEVTFKTSAPPDQPDVMNIDIVVKERNTGSIQLGAGYGSATGFQLQGQVNQSNFLGKGQRLGAGLNISRDISTYNFNFTEPHVNDTDWSAGFDVFESYANRYDYTESKRGASVRLGHPIDEDLFASVRYKYEKTALDRLYEEDANGVRTLITDPVLYPLDTASGDTSSITGIIEYDKRNDRFSPSKGAFASASLEYAGLGGNLKYSKGNTTLRYFKKLFWEVVWRNNLSYSVISAHQPGVEPPFNELFLLGGPYSLRGYRFFRIGKSVFSDFTFNRLKNPPYSRTDEDARRLANKPFGGKQQLLYQTEFEFPLIAEAGIKGVTFFDVGQAEDQISADSFYSNVGFGFRWFSPIGPLRFEWGFPLRPSDASPDTVVFEFSIGAPF